MTGYKNQMWVQSWKQREIKREKKKKTTEEPRVCLASFKFQILHNIYVYLLSYQNIASESNHGQWTRSYNPLLILEKQANVKRIFIYSSKKPQWMGWQEWLHSMAPAVEASTTINLHNGVAPVAPSSLSLFAFTSDDQQTK